MGKNQHELNSYQSNAGDMLLLRFLGFDCICTHKSNRVKLSAAGKPATNKKDEYVLIVIDEW